MIHVTRALDQDEDELRRAGRIATAIERALTGEIRLGEIVAARRRSEPQPAEVFDVEPEVKIDNSLSSRFSLVEIAGLDRRGLLFNITAVMSQLDLNIGSAHIATFGERASDTFYVTDFTGREDHRRDAQGADPRYPAWRLRGQPGTAAGDAGAVGARSLQTSSGAADTGAARLRRPNSRCTVT